MCRAIYDDGPEVYRQATRRARKYHSCEECGRVIAPGEFYTSVFQVWEGGSPCTFKTCAHCRVAEQWLVHNCGGFVFERVREELVEHAGEYPNLALPLLRVAVGMRREWKGFRGGLMGIPRLPPPIVVEASL